MHLVVEVEVVPVPQQLRDGDPPAAPGEALGRVGERLHGRKRHRLLGTCQTQTCTRFFIPNQLKIIENPNMSIVTPICILLIVHNLLSTIGKFQTPKSFSSTAFAA